MEPGTEWAAQLGRSNIFAALSDAARLRLAGRGTPVRLNRGERLCSAGDPGDSAYLLINGEVEVALSRADGTETWLARVEPGNVIGDMAVLDGGVRSADMTATRNSQLLRLSREAIMETLHEEPAAALRLLEILAARLRATNNLVEVSTSLDLGARLARLLLEAERRETRSQSELARIASASRESVNRKLSQWRAVGWVDIGPSGIAVLDRAALRREAKLDE